MLVSTRLTISWRLSGGVWNSWRTASGLVADMTALHGCTQIQSEQKNQGTSLGCRGALVEVRGDWKFMKEVFYLPGWNENAGCCWRCNCTPADIRTVGLEAPWRQPQNRLSHWQLLQRMLQNGKRPSPLWGAPWVQSTIFKIDWLHCADTALQPIIWRTRCSFSCAMSQELTRSSDAHPYGPVYRRFIRSTKSMTGLRT
jgi:hypothetical protein